MEERIGDWLQTYTGIQFWPFDPRENEIDIEDICHSLSHQCRFAGHCEAFYSVAEHSVRASWICETLSAEAALGALLHDASEAYLIDIPRPVKRAPAMKFYLDAERTLTEVIAKRFSLASGFDKSPQVVAADERMLATEARDLMKKPPAAWSPMPWPLMKVIVPWSSSQVKTVFMSRFFELCKRFAKERGE